MKSGGASCLSFLPCKHFNGVCALHHQHSTQNWNETHHTGQCSILDTECLRSTIQSLQVCYELLQCSLSEVLWKVARLDRTAAANDQISQGHDAPVCFSFDRSSFYPSLTPCQLIGLLRDMLPASLASKSSCCFCCKSLWYLPQPNSPAVTDVTDTRLQIEIHNLRLHVQSAVS